MPALTTDRLTPSRDANYADYPVRANTIIYSGALVALITSGTGAGNAVPASDAANRVILGVAQARADNSQGADGATRVVVAFNRAFKFNLSGGATSADIGKAVYAVDDNTVSLSPGTNGVKVGKLIAIEPDGVWVYIHTPAPPNRAATNTVDATYDANEAAVIGSLRTLLDTYTI
jgi:hypothetical protein